MKVLHRGHESHAGRILLVVTVMLFSLLGLEPMTLDPGDGTVTADGQVMKENIHENLKEGI